MALKCSAIVLRPLSNNLAIRFAYHGQAIPNMEIKFVRDAVDRFSFVSHLSVLLGPEQLSISEIPLQIAYKREILKSVKDLEDAAYLEKLFQISPEIIKNRVDFLRTHGKI